jgi:hypothetical protein
MLTTKLAPHAQAVYDRYYARFAEQARQIVFFPADGLKHSTSVTIRGKVHYELMTAILRQAGYAVVVDRKNIQFRELMTSAPAEVVVYAAQLTEDLFPYSDRTDLTMLVWLLFRNPGVQKPEPILIHGSPADYRVNLTKVHATSEWALEITLISQGLVLVHQTDLFRHQSQANEYADTLIAAAKAGGLKVTDLR